MVYDQAEIEQHVVQTYSEIINPAKHVYNEDHLANFLTKYDITIPRISEEMKADLARKITNEQIDDAVANLRNDAAPGPDGYSGDIIKHVYEMIPHLFQVAIAKEIGDDIEDETQTLQLKLRTMIFIPKTNKKRT